MMSDTSHKHGTAPQQLDLYDVCGHQESADRAAITATKCVREISIDNLPWIIDDVGSGP